MSIGIEIHEMTMVWSALKRGVWRFEALAGGDGTAGLDFRTFTVTAYTGG
jgi:hypothetical protein